MSSTTTQLSRLIANVSSYDGNVLLAAVISLLLVILFVLLLHIYAKWFLEQARQRRRRSSMSVSHVLRPNRFHHFHSFTFDSNSNNNTVSANSSSDGLDSSTIASIPLFVYSSSNEYCKHGLECVVCLSGFEENDVGRSLPKCGHVFHVECIDMWFHSHSNCPICRAPVNGGIDKDLSMDSGVELLEIVVVEEDQSNSRLENVVISDAVNSNCEADLSDISTAPSPPPPPSSSSSSSSSLSCSLKRMLSRNNRSECKIFPSSIAIVNQLDTN